VFFRWSFAASFFELVIKRAASVAAIVSWKIQVSWRI
jgi:hypothetical protein